MGTKIHAIDIANALEREIVANRMIPGVRLPSAAELARRYLVSPKTADRALDRLARRKLVVRKRGSGNFVLTHGSPDSRLRVGVLYWSLNESADELRFNPSDIFLSTLKKLMEERFINCSIIIEDSLKLEQPVNREKKYDMFLIPAGVILNDRQVYRASMRVPMVIYGDCKYNPGPWHQVIYDFRPGFTAALKYCRKTGVRRFFFPFADRDILCEKRDALLACAEELGFRRDDFHICHVPQDIGDTIAAGEYCAEYFLRHHLQDHLIFSASDFLAFGMQKVFRREKLNCSADYRMISYDNFRKYLAGDSDILNISSITHPLEDHAKAIVDMIGELDRHPGTDYRRVYITAAKEFVVR